MSEAKKDESELSALLCGRPTGSPVVVYREEDQQLLDVATKNLRDYEESLMFRLRKDGLNLAANGRELRSAFISDPTRIALCDALVEMYRLMLPEKAIYTIAT